MLQFVFSVACSPTSCVEANIVLSCGENKGVIEAYIDGLNSTFFLFYSYDSVVSSTPFSHKKWTARPEPPALSTIREDLSER